MERYIAHALAFESGETLRSTGSPKIRNATLSHALEAFEQIGKQMTLIP